MADTSSRIPDFGQQARSEGVTMTGMKARGIVAFTVASTALLVACGSSGGKTATGFVVPGSNTPASASPTPSATPDLSTRLVTWFDGGGKTTLVALSTDLGNLQTADEAVDWTGMDTAAVQLKVDVDHAQALPPIPDAASEEEWSAALSDYSTAATDEITAATDQDAVELASATSAMNDADSHLQVATALVPKAGS